MSAEKTLIRDAFLPLSRPTIGEAEIAELLDDAITAVRDVAARFAR
jgi:hypothetical protein